MIDLRALIGAALLLACTEHTPPPSGQGEPQVQEYLWVADVVGGSLRPSGRELLVRGTVVEGSVMVNHTTEEYRYLIESGGEQLQVVQIGVLPEFFREGSDVVVHGQLTDDRILQASRVQLLEQRE